MKGSLVCRNGHYSIILEGKDSITGKRKQEWVAAGDDYRMAEKKMTKLVHDKNEGVFIKPQKTTIKDYLTSWLKDNALPNMTPRTYEGYQFMVEKHIIPAIGQVTITGLTPQHIQKLCAEKQAAGHHRTAQYIFNTLNKSLNVAVKAGLLIRNPCDGVESPKVPKHEMQVMSETDMHIFLEFAHKSQYYALFFTALYTGMRRSELLALRWTDVNLLLMQLSANRTLHVMRYGTYKGQIIFKQPKTAKSRRLISLTPSSVITLREHLEARKRSLKTLNPKFDPEKDFNQDELVFCNIDGTPYLPDGVSHAWMKLVNKCGMKGIRFHDSRHTHASLLLKDGTHPKIVQERLGHASIETTLDTYSHVAPGLQKAAALRFDDLVTGKQKVLAETPAR